MLKDVLALSHYFQIGWVVVVFVAINVMHDFPSLKRSSNHLLSYNTMLMAPIALAVCRFLDGIKPFKLRRSVCCSALLFRGGVMRIAVAAYTLRVHSTHAVAVNRLATVFDLAGG
jgi:hypothetical protein